MQTTFTLATEVAKLRQHKLRTGRWATRHTLMQLFRTFQQCSNPDNNSGPPNGTLTEGALRALAKRSRAISAFDAKHEVMSTALKADRVEMYINKAKAIMIADEAGDDKQVYKEAQFFLQESPPSSNARPAERTLGWPDGIRQT